MTAKVILNPYSNRWTAKKQIPEVEAALRATGVDFETVISPEPGGPVALAQEAVRAGFSPIIACGGDGTVGDVVHGMAAAAEDEQAPLGPLGIIPLGTGNDLAWKLGIPKNISQAASIIATGRTRMMDIGKVNQRYFANNSAIGIEPYVGVYQIELKRIKGAISYLIAAFKGIRDKPIWNGTVEWDGGSYEGLLSIVTVGNGSRSGGMFHMIPHADPFDSKLTFVSTHRKTRRELLRTMLQLLQGSHVEEEDVIEEDFTWMKVRLDSPSPAHTDGEIFARSIQALEYQVQPGRLEMITPA
jgi:diacylglycerol kinase (ATP)